MLTRIDENTIEAVPLGRILGIDYGAKRIGVAKSDPSQILASSLVTIKNSTRHDILSEIRAIVERDNIKAIVVGMPVNMNGTQGPKAKETMAFARFLANSELPLVILWDERWTTRLAQQSLHSQGKSSSKSRDYIDQIAAGFLLQNFLDRLGFLRKNRNE